MARRKDGLLDALFGIAFRLPWWLSLTLAVLSYPVLHPLASGPAPTFTPGQLGNGFASQLMQTFARVGQYFLPFIFAVGAIGSIGVNLRGKQLNQRVGNNPSRKALEGMRWREFELMVMEWFRKQGYTVRDTDLGADGGVDIVLKRDGETYLVQCKQWRSYKVGVNIVRELRGVMSVQGAAGGFVVTSGVFTDDARQFAREANIVLIDGSGLTKVFHQHEKIEPRSPQPAQAQFQPNCPRCGAEMVERKASRGANAGKYFWGCSRYPTCRGTLPSHV
jgi:restriction system protein